MRAAPHNGERRFGERFWHKRKYEKCGNTGCISHFSYCALGAKDPPKPAVPIVRCCLRKMSWGKRAGKGRFGMQSFRGFRICRMPPLGGRSASLHLRFLRYLKGIARKKGAASLASETAPRCKRRCVKLQFHVLFMKTDGRIFSLRRIFRL